MDESQVDDVYRAEAESYVKDHPARTFVAVAASWGRIFGVYRPTQEMSYTSTEKIKGVVPAWMATISFYVLFAFAVYGVVVLRRKRIPVSPLLVFWVMILFSITLTFAQQRYRAIGEPTLVLLTAVALDDADPPPVRCRDRVSVISVSGPGRTVPGPSGRGPSRPRGWSASGAASWRRRPRACARR